MGYKIDHAYEIDAIVMNRKPGCCEVCPFYAYSLKADGLGCCTVLDIMMPTDRAEKEILSTCMIRTREEMEAHT